MKFNELISNIQETHLHLQKHTLKAINIHLTLRNWLVGFYLIEFEQNGEDRASYGAKLLKSVSLKLNIKGLGETNLKLCRQFYFTYKQLILLFNPDTKLLSDDSIRQLLTDQLNLRHELLIATTIIKTCKNCKF